MDWFLTLFITVVVGGLGYLFYYLFQQRKHEQAESAIWQEHLKEAHEELTREQIQEAEAKFKAEFDVDAFSGTFPLRDEYEESKKNDGAKSLKTKALLLARACEAVKRAERIEKGVKPINEMINTMPNAKQVSEQLMAGVKAMELEMTEIRQEADSIENGWGKIVVQQAADLTVNLWRRKEMMKSQMELQKKAQEEVRKRNDAEKAATQEKEEEVTVVAKVSVLDDDDDDQPEPALAASSSASSSSSSSSSSTSSSSSSSSTSTSTSTTSTSSSTEGESDGNEELPAAKKFVRELETNAPTPPMSELLKLAQHICKSSEQLKKDAMERFRKVHDTEAFKVDYPAKKEYEDGKNANRFSSDELKRELRKRALAAVAKANRIQRAVGPINMALGQGQVPDPHLIQAELQAGVDALNQEMGAIVAEANVLAPGWGQVVMKEAMQLYQATAELEAKKAAEAKAKEDAEKRKQQEKDQSEQAFKELMEEEENKKKKSQRKSSK